MNLFLNSPAVLGETPFSVTTLYSAKFSSYNYIVTHVPKVHQLPALQVDGKKNAGVVQSADFSLYLNAFPFFLNNNPAPACLIKLC